MKFYLLSDNTDTKIGMRLAGVEGKVIHGEEEFRHAFEQALQDGDTAVLLITEKLAELAPDCVAKQKAKNAMPLIVQLPDRHFAKTEVTYE